MAIHSGPLYESTFVVAGEARVEFRRWLDDVLRRALREPGIDEARIFATDGGDPEDDAGVTAQFRAHDDLAFVELRDGFFADIGVEAAEMFGERVVVDSHALRSDHPREFSAAENPNCLNCNVRLRGQYCGNCGQRARSRLISIWQLLREAFGDLFELDSRLWQTVGPLLIRPGQLTRDYLQGRRARYMPPFRTYLVLSVLFFVVAFFDPRDDFSLLFEAGPQATADPTAETAGTAGTDEDNTGACNIDAEDWNEMPPWLAKRLTRDRMIKVCERIELDEGKTFVDLLLDRIPVALIVLLPLMAVVLKILYPLSRRYFVEHLLFFVHFHAFFFLILTLQILFGRIAALLPVPRAIPILMIVAASLYVPVYLYQAMRRVYGQGHLLTIGKYVVLLTAYVSGASLTLLGAVVFALLSV